jgi:hypothetical protein
MILEKTKAETAIVLLATFVKAGLYEEKTGAANAETMFCLVICFMPAKRGKKQ